MTYAIFISALLLGLASSLHCIGMCGPLMISAQMHLTPKQHKWFGILFYQLGRITTYMLLGFLAGIIGWRIGIAGWQQTFSIVIGLLVLVFLFGKIVFEKSIQWRWFNQRIQLFMTWSMHRRGLLGMYIMGAANGLLPCGMVYFALSAAMITTTAFQAVLFMLVFGLGTLPALYVVTFWGGHLHIKYRRFFNKAAPVILGFTAILLILRGLNLNIPYVSPDISQRSMDTVACH